MDYTKLVQNPVQVAWDYANHPSHEAQGFWLNFDMKDGSEHSGACESPTKTHIYCNIHKDNESNLWVKIKIADVQRCTVEW